MKKLLITFTVVLAVGFTLTSMKSAETIPGPDDGVEIPESVKQILKTSCMDCHNIDGKNDDAKDAIMFDQLDTYKSRKLVGKLSEVIETLEEGEMPPEKYLKKKPHAALSDEQKETLISWAKSTADGLMK